RPPPGEPPPLQRLERRSPAAQHPLPRLQHTLSDSAVGRCPTPGLAHPRPYGPPDLAGLGAHLWALDLFSGNLRRPGTLSRDMLPGGELGNGGANHGARQRRLDASAEPVDQGGARASHPPAVSRVTTGGQVSVTTPHPEGTPQIDVSCEELEALLEKVRPELGEAGYQKLQAAIRTLGYVTELLQNQEETLASLRRLLCHSSTEKTSEWLKQAGIEPGDNQPQPTGATQTSKRATAGHGRNGAAAYRGSRKVAVPHASLKAGDPCPDARCRGKVYPQRDPGVLVRIKGQAPIAATVYELEKLRCNLCGDVFTAAAPEGVGEKKYDETAASMIALLRYGSGVPWYRLQGLEKSLGIPLPVATQCEIVAETAVILQPALQELKRQAAQGEVVHNDDTSMRVLSLERDADISPEWIGVFTSGVVWIFQGRRIPLFFTGCKHAGENLAEMMKQRLPICRHRFRCAMPYRGMRQRRPACSPH